MVRISGKSNNCNCAATCRARLRTSASSACSSVSKAGTMAGSFKGAGTPRCSPSSSPFKHARRVAAFTLFDSAHNAFITTTTAAGSRRAPITAENALSNSASHGPCSSVVSSDWTNGPADSAADDTTAARNHSSPAAARANCTNASAASGVEKLPSVNANCNRTRGCSSRNKPNKAARTCSSSRNDSDNLNAWTRTSGAESCSARQTSSADKLASPSRVYSTCSRVVSSEAWASWARSSPTTEQSCRSTNNRWAVSRHQPFACARNPTSCALSSLGKSNGGVIAVGLSGTIRQMRPRSAPAISERM